MGIFATPQTDQFSDLDTKHQTILAANAQTIQVNGIIITNVTTENIQFNLDRVTTPLEGDPIITRVIINRIIPSPYRRKGNDIGENVIAEFPYFLGNNPTGSEDHLVCYSNAPNQKFNVQISYTILNETPFSDGCN